MAIKTPRDLFIHHLKTMYYIENTLVGELEKMSREVTNDKLKKGFQEHADQTSQQVNRLERVFEYISESPEENESAALDGLVQEADELNDEITEEGMLNVAYNNAAMKVERLEITGYEGLLQLAKELDIDDDAEDLLEQNLEEEEETLKELKSVAKGSKMKNLIDKFIG